MRGNECAPVTGWACVLLLAFLVVACGGGATTRTPGPDVARTTASPTPVRNIDKVDEVFLRLLIVYQAQGLNAARQFARDQGLMTPKEDVRVTLVLDSDDPAVVDGTALAVGRLGGRVTATFSNQIEIAVPVQAALEYSKAANKQSFFADLADFAHIRDIRRTPIAQPVGADSRPTKE